MRIDWPVLMRAGMRGLGLSPEAFWNLTPSELALLLGEGGGGRPLGRARLKELMAAFPDASAARPDDPGEADWPGAARAADAAAHRDT